MTIGTRLFTWLHGEFVGKDEFGNRYFRERRVKPGRRDRRWVLYRGEAEASKVPPLWHAWLHRTIDNTPADETPAASHVHSPSWQKEYEPNMTGSSRASRPPGHILSKGQRARATGDYNPWRPSGMPDGGAPDGTGGEIHEDDAKPVKGAE
jgi:NADH:ubiquinone oxidoreductase subunit